MTATAAAASTETRNRVLLGVAFGFIAAASYGGSQVLAREGVSDLAPPLVGSLLALFWGTLGFSLMAVRGLRTVDGDFRRGAVLFSAAGIFSAIGVVLMFQALSRGQVVVVSPVLATNPLFTLILAAIFLRDVEQLTRRVVIGAVLVVIGVAVLSLA